MIDILSRIWQDLSGRIDGPLSFRFILQPLMAIFFATRDGIQDAKRNDPAYFSALVTDPEHRAQRLRRGWKSVGRVFCFAILMDVVYQILVLRRIYPTEILIVAVALAIIPYVALRGPVRRAAHYWMQHKLQSKHLLHKEN